MGEDKSIPPPNTRRQGGMRNEHRHPHPFGAYLPMSHVGLERGGKKLRWLSSFIPRPQLLLPSTHQLPSSHSNTPRRRSLMGSVVMASRSIKFVSTDSSINQLQKRVTSIQEKRVDSSSGGLVVTAADVIDPNLLLPSVLPFKRIKLTDRYPKGQTRGWH
uniref:Uncharacterized protein n=2 Tax=Physcomitrium patens TaxID=3218 RepID=A0A7I4B951_PHYPA